MIPTTINNPPVNLWDYKFAADVSTFIGTLATTANTSDIKVVILSSEKSHLFINHIDIHAELSAAFPKLPLATGARTGIQLLETEFYLQARPIILVAEIDGSTTGTGDEVAVQCDISYAGPGAKLSQLEIGLGRLPCTGGLQLLIRLNGRARALEFISVCSVDALEAVAIDKVH